MSKHIIILSILPFMLGINVNASNQSITVEQRVGNLETEVQNIQNNIAILTQNQGQQSEQLNNIKKTQQQQLLQLNTIKQDQERNFASIENYVIPYQQLVDYPSREEIDVIQPNAAAATQIFVKELSNIPSKEAKLQYIQEHGLESVPGLVDAINNGQEIDKQTIAQLQDNIARQLLSNPSKREEILNNYGVYTNGKTPGNIPGVPTQNQYYTNPSINQNITNSSNSSNMEPGLPINQYQEGAYIAQEGAYIAGVTQNPNKVPEYMIDKPEQTQGYSDSGQIYPTQSDGSAYIASSDVYTTPNNNTPVNSSEQMNREILNGLDNINNEEALLNAARNSKELQNVINDYKNQNSIQGQLSPEDINNIKQKFANRVINNQNYNDEYPDMTHSQLNLSTSANPDDDRDIRAQILHDNLELANQMTQEEQQNFIYNGIVPKSKQQLKKELDEIQNSYNEQANIEVESKNIIEKLQNAPAEQRRAILEKYQNDGTLPPMTPDQINNCINTGKLPDNNQFYERLQNNIAQQYNMDNNLQYNAPELNELAMEMAKLTNEHDRNTFLIQNPNLQNIPGIKEWVQTGTVPDLSHLNTPTKVDQMNNINNYLPASVNVNAAKHPMLPDSEAGPQVLDDFNIDYTSLNNDELITKLRRALSDLKTCECNCQILKSQIASQNTPTINQNIPSDIKLDETSNVPTMFNKQPNNILSAQTIVQPSINNSLDDINTNIPTNIATPSSNMNTNVGISNTNIQSGNIVVQESNINQVPVSKKLTIEQNNTQNIDAENDAENDEFSNLRETMDNTTPETQWQPVIGQQKNVIPIGDQIDNQIFTPEINQYINDNTGEEHGNENEGEFEEEGYNAFETGNIEPNAMNNQQIINQPEVLPETIETSALQNQPIDNEGNIVTVDGNNNDPQIRYQFDQNIPQENFGQEKIIQDTNIDVEQITPNEPIYIHNSNIMQQQGRPTISTPNEQNSMRIQQVVNPNIIIDQNNLNNNDIIAQEQFINEKEPPENQQKIIDPNEEKYMINKMLEASDDFEEYVNSNSNDSFYVYKQDNTDVNQFEQYKNQYKYNNNQTENMGLENNSQKLANETQYISKTGQAQYAGQNLNNIPQEQENNDFQGPETENIEHVDGKENINGNIDLNQDKNNPYENKNYIQENAWANNPFMAPKETNKEYINEFNGDGDENKGNEQMGESQEGFDTNNYDDNQLNEQGAEDQEEGDGNEDEENEQSMWNVNDPQNPNERWDNPNDLNNKALFNFEFAPAIETEQTQIVDNDNNDFLNMDPQGFGSDTDFQSGDKNMSGQDINLEGYDNNELNDKQLINNNENLQNAEGTEELFAMNDWGDINDNNDAFNAMKTINKSSNSSGNKIFNSGINKGFHIIKDKINKSSNNINKQLDNVQEAVNSYMNKWKK